jgi:LysR family hydrogen peroxide-inducible transcriptional activator
MELRHLDALVAIDDHRSFTAAADALHTVQSNVSDMIRQLEAELGVTLLVRGRRGAEPTEFGAVVLDRARRVHGELAAMHQDISMLLGLEVGHASLGVVGTVSRWIVPELVAQVRRAAPSVRLRVNEGASERLAAEVAEREIAQAVLTEPVTDPRLVVEHLFDEDIVGLVPIDFELGTEPPVALSVLAELPLILPPLGNPLRDEVEIAARDQAVSLRVAVEVEGVRLIADLVAAGAGVSMIPETAVPSDATTLRAVPIADMPPRRLALVTARGTQLSMADRAVHDAVVRIVRAGPHPTPDQ